MCRSFELLCVCIPLQPFLGSGEASNRVVGKIKLGSETLSTIDGHWDQEVFIKDKRTGVSTCICSCEEFYIMSHTQGPHWHEELYINMDINILLGE